MASRPLQLALLEGDERRVGGLVPSVIGGTNADLIAAVAPLYLTGSVLDVTYGRGIWWRRFSPAPFGRHDIELDGVDFRELPEADQSWETVCFDPPYVPRHGQAEATRARDREFRQRYGLADSRSMTELNELIVSGLAECARVARRWLLVKCCDYTNGGTFRLGHLVVLGEAERLGFVCHDLIVHLGHGGPGGSRIVTQVRARRHHSYLIVLRRSGSRAAPALGPQGIGF